MSSAQRQPEPRVIARLRAQPERFTFAQAINLLLAALQREGVDRERAFRTVLRFRNSLSLSFPASEIAALEIERNLADDGVPGALKTVRITPAFIGLLGGTGTLPLHDSERLSAQRQVDRDDSQHALIDVFSNRMIGLFYETWGKYRVEHGARVHGQDRLLPMLLALAGHGGAHGPAGTRQSAAYYAGILRMRPVSASAIERVLRDHFGVPIRLEQFVGCWDPIPPARRSTFGSQGPVLGLSTVLGTRLWRHDLRARLHIGPLDERQLSDFLPGGSARRALAETLSIFAAGTVAWEIRLLLAEPAVKRLTLTTAGEPRKLGWTSFLTEQQGVAQRPHTTSILAPASR